MVQRFGPFLGLRLQPAELLFADHHALAGLQDPAVAGVDHDQPAAPEVPPVAEPHALVAVDLTVGPLGQLGEVRPGVALGGQQALVVLVVGQLVGAQIAQVLVHPVGRQPGPDPVLPPRLLCHVRAPGRRRVPVVANVVIVEDHRRGHGRHQPPDLRVTPRVPVQPFVFGEADDLVRGTVAVPVQPCPAAGHAALLVGRKLVGVELITEQDQGVGPLVDREAGHPRRITVQRVELQLGLDLLDFGFRVATRPEDGPQPRCASRSAGSDHARRELRERRVGQWPSRGPVDGDLVLGHAVGGQAGHQDEGEVVALHLERLRRAAENLDSARIFGLHPHQRRGVRDVPQRRTKEQPHRNHTRAGLVTPERPVQIR